MSDMNRPNGMQVPEEGFQIMPREEADKDAELRKIRKELADIRNELHRLTATIERAALKR